MSSADQELLSAFDGHDVESVRAALEGGANADWGLRCGSGNQSHRWTRCCDRTTRIIAIHS